MQSPADNSDLVTTDVEYASRIIKAGGLVAIPTETVYGLAADASQPEAVARIFDIKGRPTDHPLIIHLADLESAEGWVSNPPAGFETLADACWPGPLTMLVPRGPRVIDAVTGGRPTVGLRVPSHPLTHTLLKLVATGLAAPSANRFGKVSPTTASHVAEDLDGLLEPGRDTILDGGPCRVGVESTIVDLTVSPSQVLRSGAISAEDVRRILESPVDGPTGERRASGMLQSHYSPRCDVLLANDLEHAETISAEQISLGRSCDVLDQGDDLVLAARELYGNLRNADTQMLDALVVVLPPANGLGIALRDRLSKAAANPGPID